MNTNAVYVFLPFTTEKRASFRKLAEETAKSPCFYTPQTGQEDAVFAYIETFRFSIPWLQYYMNCCIVIVALFYMRL